MWKSQCVGLNVFLNPCKLPSVISLYDLGWDHCWVLMWKQIMTQQIDTMMFTCGWRSNYFRTLIVLFLHLDHVSLFGFSCFQHSKIYNELCPKQTHEWHTDFCHNGPIMRPVTSGQWDADNPMGPNYMCHEEDWLTSSTSVILVFITLNDDVKVVEPFKITLAECLKQEVNRSAEATQLSASFLTISTC